MFIFSYLDFCNKDLYSSHPDHTSTRVILPRYHSPQKTSVCISFVFPFTLLSASCTEGIVYIVSSPLQHFPGWMDLMIMTFCPAPPVSFLSKLHFSYQCHSLHLKSRIFIFRKMIYSPSPVFTPIPLSKLAALIHFMAAWVSNS